MAALQLTPRAQPCLGMGRILPYTKPQGAWAKQLLLRRRLQNPTVCMAPFLADLWVHSAHVRRPVCPSRLLQGPPSSPASELAPGHQPQFLAGCPGSHERTVPGGKCAVCVTVGVVTMLRVGTQKDRDG